MYNRVVNNIYLFFMDIYNYNQKLKQKIIKNYFQQNINMV